HSKSPAIQYFTKRDLLEKQVEPIETIWELPVVQRIRKKQQTNGSWKSTSKNRQKYPVVNYDLTETWRQFRYLIEQYELKKTIASVELATEYIFSCQTEEGDIRGILGKQYAAYYTGALLSLLIKAGYESDPRIEKGMQWLLSVRQKDGGWLANALMALDIPWKEVTRLTSQDVELVPYQNFDKPSSHNWTGMVIRAFAEHPKYKKQVNTKKAGELLKKRFFQKDPHYTSLQAADYWIKFQFPFWWNNLVAALDSLSKIGFSSNDPDIKMALDWLIKHQQENGLWKISYSQSKPVRYTEKTKEMQSWITLVICRILKRFIENI
ncbi:MAG: prenyltransferase/squalene oxidase repeat-containing protein, partial [Promethearchaeota archaeon]